MWSIEGANKFIRRNNILVAKYFFVGMPVFLTSEIYALPNEVIFLAFVCRISQSERRA